MHGELLRERLHRGERVYGTQVCSLGNPFTAKMQSQFGYDFIFICTEHVPLDRTETAAICHYYAAQGIAPLVRIPRPSHHDATMALDGGAHGIVVPYVETVEEVKEMVGAVKYRPFRGQVLKEFLSGERRPAQKTLDYINRSNRNNCLIIGIESVPAYENLDALISVPGVDGVFIGPHDLTASMETPEEYTNPKFMALQSDIIKRCRAAGIGVGAGYNQMVVSDDYINRLIDEGMNWVLYGADITMLGAAMKENLAGFRERLGDLYQPGAGTPSGAVSCIGAGKKVAGAFEP